ncbi:MAG: hypothetical protein ACLSBF_05550 [Alphaproteobacteria bacterium]
MMKNAALRNLQRYATTEHIFGIGMATKKNEAALSLKKTNFSSVRTNDRDNEKREFLLDDEDDVMWER